MQNYWPVYAKMCCCIAVDAATTPVLDTRCGEALTLTNMISRPDCAALALWSTTPRDGAVLSMGV